MLRGWQHFKGCCYPLKVTSPYLVTVPFILILAGKNDSILNKVQARPDSFGILGDLFRKLLMNCNVSRALAPKQQQKFLGYNT